MYSLVFSELIRAKIKDENYRLARRYFRRLAGYIKERLGPTSTSYSDYLSEKAYFEYRLGNYTNALALIKKNRALIAKLNKNPGRSDNIGASIDYERINRFYTDVALRIYRETKNNQYLVDAFETLQLARYSESAAAIKKLSDRAISTDKKLRLKLRELQDTKLGIQKLIWEL